MEAKVYLKSLPQLLFSVSLELRALQFDFSDNIACPCVVKLLSGWQCHPWNLCMSGKPNFHPTHLHVKWLYPVSISLDSPVVSLTCFYLPSSNYTQHGEFPESKGSFIGHTESCSPVCISSVELGDFKKGLGE